MDNMLHPQLAPQPKPKSNRSKDPDPIRAEARRHAIKGGGIRAISPGCGDPATAIAVFARCSEDTQAWNPLGTNTAAASAPAALLPLPSTTRDRRRSAETRVAA